MARLIQCKIDVKKINKDLLYKGEKGTYLNLTLIETPGGKYGEWLIVEDKAKGASKEDKGTILGNGKNKNWGADSGGSGEGPSLPASKPTMSTDDMPF